MKSLGGVIHRLASMSARKTFRFRLASKRIKVFEKHKDSSNMRCGVLWKMGCVFLENMMGRVFFGKRWGALLLVDTARRNSRSSIPISPVGRHVMVYQGLLEVGCTPPPVNVEVLRAFAESNISRHEFPCVDVCTSKRCSDRITCVRYDATFCLPLLDMNPVSLSSLMLASTSGCPVVPSTHLRNPSLSLSHLQLLSAMPPWKKTLLPYLTHRKRKKSRTVSSHTTQ